MLTAAVYAGKRFFVQQTNHIMLFGKLLHNLHCQLVVICSNICCGEYRSKLMLCRSNLVMLCLCQDSQLPKLLVQLLHECRNSRFDYAEVMVVKFLSLWRTRTEKCTSGINQILALVVHLLIYKEVFLLRSDSRLD